MDNTNETLPFYFTWKGLRLGLYFPMYVEPTAEKILNDDGVEVISHTLIVVRVPADPIYVDIIDGSTLTIEGAKFCRKELERIFEADVPTHDDWELTDKADKVDDNVEDEFWNS